jgi:predicted nucleotidyltransferase|tara:strand:+ start:71 stop:358 length:288 start_codon:yes stop_codon:yes gene_type:complete
MVIRADILNSLSEIHAELTAMGVKDLWLFGSAARGELANDADFLVDFQSTPTLVGFMNLKFLLEDKLQVPVDLQTRNSCPERFMRHIQPDLLHVA